MAVKELNINPVLDTINESIAETEGFQGVKTEHTTLEVRIGLHSHGFSGYNLDAFGLVTMDRPTGHLIVQTMDNPYGGTVQESYANLMRSIADKLGEIYEVAYVHPLDAKYAPPKQSRGV